MKAPFWLKVVWSIIMIVGLGYMVFLGYQERWVDLIVVLWMAWLSTIFSLQEFADPVSDAKPPDHD